MLCNYGNLVYVVVDVLENYDFAGKISVINFVIDSHK